MVRINGKDIEAAGQNLLAYLTDQEYRTDRIAIELNGAIVSRKDYDKVTLRAGGYLIMQINYSRCSLPAAKQS